MKALRQWITLCLLAGIGLQLFFVLRVLGMNWLAPQSTSFERSQIWQVWLRQQRLPWRQDWRDLPDISRHLQRAVIASEDDAFVSHEGVRWDAVEKAWDKNTRAQAMAEKQASRRPDKPAVPAKVVGGSTITQQLAKNLFLSGERTLVRKGQEMLITVAIELALPKRRILEIYLNHVEWGEGVFGAQAAAQHYFRKPASQLGAWEAARLAVMLPRPRHYEKLPHSSYLAERAEVIVGRMNSVVLP